MSGCLSPPGPPPTHPSCSRRGRSPAVRRGRRSTRDRLLAACGLVVVGLACSPAALADEPVCSDWEVVTLPDIPGGKRARRAVGLQRARARARAQLARMAWEQSIVRDILVRARTRGESPAPSEVLAVIERSAETPAELDGGRFLETGGKKDLETRYCVSASDLERAKDRLSREHDAAVARQRNLLAAIERAHALGDESDALDLLAGLEATLYSGLMRFEVYISPLTGERDTFLGWLGRWTDALRDDQNYSRALTTAARRSIEEGHLTRADKGLHEAIRVWPDNVRAQDLLGSLEELRRERQALFGKAEEAALVGRQDAAAALLAAAEAIDADDQQGLREARASVAAMHEAFRTYNPTWNMGLHIAIGSLGVDAGGTADRYLAVAPPPPGSDSSITDLTSTGMDYQLRLTRQMVFQTSASYGFNGFRSVVPGDSQGELFLSVGQATAGFGLRTVRTAERKLSVQLLGGLAVEGVWSHAPRPEGFADSDTRLGYFARLGIRYGVTTLFVERGFGFGRSDPAPDSLIVWDDQMQFGLTFLFRGS